MTTAVLDGRARRQGHCAAPGDSLWRCSWHENAVSDQATTIDYILAVTRRPALATVGHSMGSTVQLVLLAERPEYADRLLANVVMAPPVFFSHLAGLARLASPLLRAHKVRPVIRNLTIHYSAFPCVGTSSCQNHGDTCCRQHRLSQHLL